MSVQGLLFLLASLLSFSGGLAHSILGERRLLMPLSRCPDLPLLYGSTFATIQIIRTVWHLATIAWWAAAALFFLMAQAPLTTADVSAVLAVAFLIAGTVTLLLSRGRHMGWLMFIVISAVAFWEAHSL